MTEMIVNGIGCVVLFAGGVALMGFLLGLACNYTWRKLCDAHGLKKVFAAMRAYNEDQEAPRG